MMGLFEESGIASREMQWKRGISQRENPDNLIACRGIAYIQDIARDAKVGSCLNTRIQAVIAKGWEMIPHKSNINGKSIVTKRDQEVCDFVRKVLDDIPVFSSDIIAALDCINIGYSLSEMNYKRIKKGSFAGKIGLKNIRKKNPELFSFEFDRLGYYTPVQIDPNRKNLPKSKFLHMINGLDDENPYGESVTSRVAFWVWLKKNGSKFWAKHLEKFGSPTPKIEVPANTTTGDAQDKAADDIIDALQTSSGLKVPKGFDVTLLEAHQSGAASYDEFRLACNEEIATLYLGATLATGESSRGQGTNAQATVHSGILSTYTLFDVVMSAATINQQIIRTLVDINYSVDNYPVFGWKSLDLSRLVVISQNIRGLVESGLDISADDIYEATGLRQPELGSSILKIQGQIDSMITPPKPKSKDNKAKEDFSEITSPISVETLITQNNAMVKENEAITDNEIVSLAKSFSVAAEVISKFKKFNESKIIDTIQKHIVPELYHTILQGSLSGLYHASMVINLFDTDQSSFSGEDAILTGATGPGVTMLNHLLDMNVITKAEYILLEEEAKRKAFTIAGVESKRLLGQIKEVFEKSVANGGKWADVAKTIDGIFDRAGVSPLKPWHTENVVRTNFQTIYSAAKEREFNKVSEDTFPYRMVLVVKDHRTRSSHAAFDRFCRKKNDPIWGYLKTPFDYECRCTIIVIHKSMQVAVSGSSPPIDNLRFVKKLKKESV